MDVEGDDSVGVIYLRFSSKKHAKTTSVTDSIMVDFDEDGQVIGVEIIGPMPRKARRTFRQRLADRWYRPMKLDSW